MTIQSKQILKFRKIRYQRPQSVLRNKAKNQKNLVCLLDPRWSHHFRIKLKINKFELKQSIREKEGNNILVKRDKYRKRKDVLMKGVLRQCRKYYQEKYMNFVRINSTEFIPSENNADDNIFPNNIIENPQQLIKEALEKFWLSEFKSQFKNPDLMFYTGKLKNLIHF